MATEKKFNRVIVSSHAPKFSGFLSVHEYKYRRSRQDGSMSETITNLVMERGDSAAALVHDIESDQVILTSQFRLPVYLRGMDDAQANSPEEPDPGWILETPAGVVEAGEKPEATLARELREELGYAVSALEPIATFFVSPGGTTERIHLYYARVSPLQLVDPEAKGVAAEGEDIGRQSIPVAQFVEDVARGVYHDAKTIIAGLWLQTRRRPGPGT